MLKAKIFKVYTQRLMAYLVWNRHPLLGLEANRKEDKFNVFLFEETDALKEDMTYYTKNKDKIDITVVP